MEAGLSVGEVRQERCGTASADDAWEARDQQDYEWFNEVRSSSLESDTYDQRSRDAQTAIPQLTPQRAGRRCLFVVDNSSRF